ncbi:amino acid adenylation domain-containing protein [Azospirillum fermentarium]|uniref:non-ribosomal peptide synthetase/type I polyketide synthase n=1 Tax=Azospirillum fermentarium TaxID=1233114 RepID=UPI002226673B|nr:hybrid non-ribosomal peptide synthetase/type I polyketide synthase [Azospirillum fermentarium]MCW2246953.1 amino acid adenylation domain-containing protein [Azospirillum fermentarium]
MTGPGMNNDLLALLLAEDGFALPGDGPAPIPRLPDGAVVPAAPAQERLWVLDRVEGPSAAYNLAMTLRFGGAVDRGALQTALDALSERHEPLRTDLAEHDGRPVQRIHPPAPVPLPVEAVTADALDGAILRTALVPFDLGRGPLFRARWFDVAGGPGVLLLAFHHAVVDGWSVAVMIRDLTRLYAAALTGGDAGLPPLPIRYRDYAAWCADPARGAEREAARAYWRRRLDALPAALDLPRAGTPDGCCGLVPLRLDAGLTARLERFGQERGATLYMVLLAGYAALLARFTGARDLPIGTPVANRTRTETEGLVGFLVDTLVVRADVSGEPDFATLTERVRDACLEDFRHQDLPFGELVALLKPERRAGSTPLFQAMFNLLTLPAWEERIGSVHVVGEAVALPAARFDLALELQADGGAVSGRLEYRAGLIDGAVAQAMAAAYGTLLAAALDDPRRPIDTLPLMDRAAAAAWVARTNGPETPAPAETLHGLFAQRATENPAAVALIDGGTAVTYATLDRQSAALAARLRALGVGNEVPVGVCLERSAALAVAFLGVLRAGGAVLPLDPGYPPERLAFMVADSGAPVLIARSTPRWLPENGPVLVDADEDSPLLPPGERAGVRTDFRAERPKSEPSGSRNLDLGVASQRISGHSARNPALTQPSPWPSPRGGEGQDGAGPDGLAYLIYTSGSTGRPKGVMGLHRGAVNRIRWMEQAFPFAPGEVTCQKTTITFVDFIWEFFGPLLAGVPSVIVPPEASGDPLRLAETLERGGVTRLVLVPSLLRALLDGLPDPASTLRALRLCVTSGEAISADLAARFATSLPQCRLLNLYGSSEVSADATWHVVEPGVRGLVPIGRPIPGNRVLLLDRGNNPVPPGAPGEIAIGGVGLARGYAGQPALTAERFTDDPTGLAGGRLFRTGDLGRWRADGVLDYLGRLDRQVKIRGVRVEPGEVQAVLSGHAAVREAAVVARPLPSGETGLVAYVVWRGEPALADLRPFLRARLPAALVPAAFVTLERLPLNPNGKTDLAALPDPATADEGADEGAEDGTPARPLAPDEALVAAVWAEVLGITVTGGGCDFFDHGGDSLLAVRAMTRVNAAFGTALPVAALFDAPTPRALAERLRAAGDGAGLPPVPTGPRPARIPMSFNQMPLWLAERAQGAAAYNVPTAYRLDGPVDEGALERALAGLYDRHEGLRTRLTAHGDEPVQEILPPGGFQLERRSAVGLADDALDALLTAEAAHPFALDTEAPFRATLFTLGPDARLLLLVIHHTACDGTTGTLLVRELEAGYRGTALRPPAVQPADIALWQRMCVENGIFDAALEGWRADLAGAPMHLNLPRPAGAADGETAASRAGRVPVALPPDDLARLDALAREGRATLPMALMAAWALLLSRATGQDDLLIGIPAAARVRREMEETAGFLVNTLPLRVTLDGDPDFIAVVTRVRQRLLTALERQHVPLPLVADAVAAPRLPGRPPLVQALFVQQDARAWSLSLPGITAAALPVPTPVARFDLTLLVVERDGGLSGELEYDTAVVDDATARRMAERFTAILAAVAAAPHRPLSALDLLGDGDRRLNAALNAGTGGGPRPPADRLDALVSHQAAVRADAPALWWPDGTLSYGALDRRSGRFAHRLSALGVGPGDRVGLVAERGPGLFVALVGILKAGAAYVPVDPAYPAERIAAMLTDAEVTAVVAETAPPAPAVPCLFPDEDEDGSTLPADPPLSPGGRGPVDEDDAVACLIFTSGSTGRPKGVMVRHGALCRLAAALVDRYAIGPDSRIQQLVALGFDVAASDIAMAFTAGAALCLAPRDGLLPGRTLTQTLAASAATHVQIPAALLAATPVAPLPALRVLAVGGESCPADAAARWAAGRRLFFAYGPTETTVTATVAEYAPGLSPACIGRPVAGALAFVHGPHGQPVPPGTAGELCIGGDGVTAGYYGQPEMTAARFIADPATGGTLYRTGDRVRLGDDGNLLFLGRLDRQVKLHGFRIEPGEIESALAAQPGVARALVAVRPGTGDGDRGLAAFLLPAAGARLDGEAVRRAVRAVLPPHMVPSAVTVIATVPLTLHGKVDWDALFALPPTPAAPTAPSAATLSAVQERVAAIWRAVLGCDTIGLDENFFDAGGHSLRLVRVHARLEEEFARTLPISDLFRLPTIRSLAAHLAGAVDEARPAAADGGPLGGPVAVIGMACRYPGAPDVDSFWRLLVEGREGIARLDAAALAAEGLDPALLDQPGHVPARGVVDGADLFDAAFFGFSPRDAVVMDPQHRVLLECAWHALEDAGYDPARTGGPVGVFAGAGLNTYFHGVLHADGPAPEGAAAYHELTGNDKDFIATQIAYRLDLRGPAVAVQSACSTSLVAVDLACQALRAGRCRMALAGGVSIRFPQATGYRYEPGMILSPDGHCRPFADDAAGTVPGGGAGLVLLKPLALAQADGDRILAVIRGTAVTNDGAAKVGYTAPGADGQTAAIAAAIADSGLDPATIDYVETHGTGTALGDPVEVAALARVFGGRDRPLLLGAVKSNIGHADAAAGVAGLIKTVLALHHGTVPPTLHARTLNPRIDFAAGPFAVAAAAQPWPANGGPRRAGVSAFGIGGTNAHVVLEQAPTSAPAEPPADGPRLLLLSARSDDALEQAAAALAAHLAANPALPLADVAHTLAAGRAVFDHRAAAVVRDVPDAVRALSTPALIRATAPAQPPAVALLFPGQGSQSPRMGEALYRTSPAYRAALDRCAAVLEPHIGADLRALLYGPEDRAADAAALRRTSLTQPALFSVGYAAAHHWQALGVEPAAMLGHSVGEYVAACLAGVFTLDDALALVAERGRLVDGLPAGAMLALPLAEDEAAALVHGTGLSIAAVNGPRQVVVAGPIPSITELQGTLDARGVRCWRLETSHAFHSAMLDPVVPAFAARVAALTLRPPERRFVSNVTGTWITVEQATDPGYWARHLRHAVRFADGIASVRDGGAGLLLEAGPGHTLCALARSAGWSRPAVATLDADPLEAVGRLWAAGVPVTLPDTGGRRVALPTYPFQRKRFWPERAAPAPALPAKRAERESWFYQPVWRQAPAPATAPLTGPWLVLADQGGTGARLAEALAARGEAVTVVPVAGVTDDAPRLVPPPARIVHLGCLDGDDALERGFHSLTALARALGTAGVVQPVRIDVVTTGTADVTGEEALNPTAATALGAVKIIPLEYPAIRCRAIDIPPGLDTARLLDELTVEDAAPHTALRGRHRWQPDIVPAPLPPAGNGMARLRPRGVYLVTGGFGGMGAAIARDLAETLHARLVLVGRTPLPPRDEAADDPRRRLIDAIEAAGGEVLAAAADVADETAMAAVIAQARARFGAINGVIHTAGLADRGGVIQTRTRADTDAVLAPKVAGTLVLDRLLADGPPLDVMLLCSTLGSILYGAKFGQVAYAGGNEFLDLFAAERTARTGQFTQAINWDDWTGGGMTVAAYERWGHAAPSEAQALTPAEGVAVFRRALDSPHTRLAVSIRDLPALAARGAGLMDDLARHTAPAAEPAAAGLPEDGGDGSTHALLAGCWRSLLGVERVDGAADFFALGGHSLLAMQMLAFIRATFGVEIGLATLFEAPVLADLAARIDALRTPALSVPALPVNVPAEDEEEFML